MTAQPGDSTLHIMDANGNNDKVIGNGFLTIWSPVGEKIFISAFVKGEDVPSLYIIDADGKNRIELKTKGIPGSWSGDGKKLYYAGVGGGNQPDIFMMDADGKNQKQLTNTADFASFAPQISPDGKHIFFTRFPKANDSLTSMQVLVMDADGTNMKALTEDKKMSIMGSGILILLLSLRAVAQAGQ